MQKEKHGSDFRSLIPECKKFGKFKMINTPL